MQPEPESSRGRWRQPAVPAALAALLLAACAAGPAYHRPEAAAPVAYQATQGWKPAAPADAVVPLTWWEAYHDPVLDGLEQQVVAANQTLRQAEANYEQARQLARAGNASLLPALSVGGSAQRSRSRTTAATPPANNFSASAQASWEPDLWGRVRRANEAATAAAQAGAADVAAVRLALQSALAQDYIQLRVVDERRHLLAETVEAYRRTLTISQNRYQAGVTSRSDVALAQTQLDSVRAQLIDLDIQRAQLQHAIAVLTGRPPAALTLAPEPRLQLVLPGVPVAVPSQLLERRPDIAEAERQVAAANARVGVQTAAWFPTVTLSAGGGFQGSVIDQLFNLPNRFWSLGANVGETLLDWGQRKAGVAAAKAGYEATVASYRQTVLSAFQEVEDNLVSLRVLAREAEVQDAVVTEAAEAARITLNEYNAGTVDYTTVASAQVMELNSRVAALTIRGDQLKASVGLMAALGGGWTTADLPSAKQAR